ncbi:puromycin-sensitive aminopeptidase isoform X2 [Nasonia vitripennis]|uniref:Aminopeptidase n=1 Tax=Nasonia vitripennis TaxID=7425 RepID=A0A7M7G242_NASVI|nr:puromycin-sensitive aminopeptidase isoform X2 [Nasonia vitripennis]
MLLHGTVLRRVCSRFGAAAAAAAAASAPSHQPNRAVACLSRRHRRLVIPANPRRTYNNALFQASRALSSEALAAAAAVAERPVDDPRRKMSSEKKPFHRLPTNVKPHHYKIELQPDLVGFTFDGKQDVSIEVVESTNTVSLNSCDINIKSAVYNDGTGKTIQAKDIATNAENETASIIFPEQLPLGKSGFIRMEFKGEINDKLKGLYRSKYTSPDGTVKHAAVTQFEASDARRCFPCWDEPALKATFDISLVVPNDLVALSNMPVKSATPAGQNLQTLAFETTPVMSTYLVAIVIGEFDYIEDRSSDGVLVRVYTPKGKQEQGRFALHVATKVLPYYKSYFDIPYPLPKIDLIAIADFSAGAMENWGLVTYRETCLLVDPHNTSAVVKQWIALVVGHELAHQWFGNLVTMEWWTHLWLNEGYASFVEFLCVDLLFPEYDIWTQFVTDTYIKALELDALKNSHAIEVPVGHPSEIDEIFDDISYNKGASIIRMLHSYIGDDDFRKGMNLYLKRHSYANAQTEDLWNALEEASKKPVGHVMSTWTKQQGFPLLRVSEKPSPDSNKRVLSFTQERFLADGSADKDNNLWVIPITVSMSQDPKKITKKFIMESKTKDIEFENMSKSSWFKVNPGTVGVYRTLYSNDLLESFMSAIRDQSLPPLDRLGLLDDLSALSQAGHISSGDVLKMMEAFKGETNYTVWSSIVNCLSKVGILVSHLDIHAKYKLFGRSLLQNIHSRLGWDKKPEESHLDTLLRSLVLDRMISFGDEATIKEAQRRFEAHVAKKAILPADLRSPVYKAVFSAGDANTFETLLKLYREADLHEEKDRILSALGATKDEALLRRVLEFSLDEEVKTQDTVYVIMSVTMTYKGRVLAWEFFKNNYAKLIDRYQSGVLLTRLVKCTTEHFVSESYAQDVEEFFKHHPIPCAERNVQQSIETIRLNAAWLKRDQEAIEKFLKNIE